MGDVEQILNAPTQTLLTVLVILVAGKYLYELWRFYHDRFKDSHEHLVQDEKFHEQVARIEYVSEAHSRSVEKITESIEKVNNRLGNLEKQRTRDAIAYGRALMLQLYYGLKDREQITVSEFEAFSEIADMYLEAGGNSVFKDKIIPKIMNKQVKQ